MKMCLHSQFFWQQGEHKHTLVGLHTLAHLLPLFNVLIASGMIAATAKNSDMPETHTSHSKGKVVPLSLEAREFQPPLSLISPVLMKYKRYLQSFYKARALAPADKYLPTLEAPYINPPKKETGDIEDSRVLLRSLYEAQNPAILSHYFVGHLYKKKVQIGAKASQTPYDCYALSYCVAYSCDQFRVFFTIRNSDEVSLVETFVKGLADHHQHTTPRVKYLKMELDIEYSDKCVFWISKISWR
jgi:hypothetical protein